MVLLRKLLSGLADFLLPRMCPLCGARMPLGGGRVVCSPCLEGLERLRPPWCPKCGKPFVSEMTLAHSPDHLCAECRERPPAFDRARALGPLEGQLRELVHLLKYEGYTSIASELGPELGRLAREEFPDTTGSEGTLVTFVPIDPARWRERGFDQAGILARHAAEWMELPWASTLERKKAVSPQTGLPAARRRRNLQGVFSPREAEPVLGRRVLLVDDVLTTGSTASACARTLKGAGAEAVEVVTVCNVAHPAAGGL